MTPRDRALLALCESGWANQSKQDGTATVWRISIDRTEQAEVIDALPTEVSGPLTVQDLAAMLGHFLVTVDGASTDVQRFASPMALERVWSA